MGIFHIFKGPRSLTRDFSLRFFVLTLLLSILVFSASGFTIVKIQDKNFKQESFRIFQEFKKLIVPPLWHYDDEQIASICKTFITGGTVNKITIYSSDNRALYTYGSTKADNLFFESFSEDIFYKKNKIGRVDFYTGRERFTQINTYYLLITVLAITLISLFISIMTWRLLNTYVRKPLEALLVWINQIRMGNYADTRIDFPQKEIKDVVHNFSLMVDSVKIREQELRESEEKYRLLIENMPSVTWITNVNGETTFISPLVEKIYGFSQEEIYEKGESLWLGRIHPDDQDLVKKTFERAFSENLIFDIEYRIQRKDGKWIWLHDTIFNTYERDGVEYAYGVFSDISQRKIAEEALRESERRYRLLADNMTDNLWVLDLGSLKFTYISPSVERITGYTDEETLGRQLTDVLTPSSMELAANTLAEELSEEHRQADPSRSRILELEQYHKNGTTVWTEVAMRFIYDNDGRPTAILGVTRDVSRRKRLENQLRQTQKMEAIGTLAGGIAHDFNNILSSVFGFAELAKLELARGENIDAYLDEVLNAGFRARDLVKQILAFSRQTDIEKTSIAIDSLVKESIKFMKASLPSTIEIKYDFKAENALILADPTQLHQILMNLSTNASHAMHEKGGILELGLRRVDIDENKILSGSQKLKSGRYIQISVSDTGRGIKEEILERIFDPFFTTKKRGEGTGMGLSVVHGIVNDMGGSIDVSSVLGEGTTFRILLPEHGGNAQESITQKQHLKKGKGRILYVDDEEGVIIAGQGILERIGYDVVSTTNPVEALEIFQKETDRFDLVITDMTMPKMTGTELSKQLLEIQPDIPIILCTGFSGGVTAENITDLGIREMIMKPVIASDLAETVSKALAPRKK